MTDKLGRGRPKGSKDRAFGAAIDARAIAEKLLAGEQPKPAKPRNKKVIPIVSAYADAVALEAVCKLEQMLRKDDIEPKQVCEILAAIRSFRQWSHEFEKEELAKGPKKPKKKSASGPDFSRFDAELEGAG